MSDEAKTDAAPKKKASKKKKLILFLIVAIVIGGGGTAGGMWASQKGYFGQQAEAKDAVDENMPKLKLREGADAPETLPKGRKPDPRFYEASYFPLKETFTSNLRDSSEMVQVSLGVSTYYDETELKAIELHQMAMRSSILLTLSNQDASVISTPEGKMQLKKDLKRAVNDVLEAKEGFGGVDDVYFTSFVIQ